MNHRQRSCRLLTLLVSGTIGSVLAQSPIPTNRDSKLQAMLKDAGFTGIIESTLTTRLGRPLDAKLVDLGRLLFFDVSGGLHNDNTCAGCHNPGNAMGDSQPIAIGIQSNMLVGERRSGPRNQRRTPGVINAAFYPALMWNGRFSSISGDPFNNSKGFKFPDPEGLTRFPANDPVVKVLLQAHSQMPPTETTEVAGFTGIKGTGTMDPRFDQFDDGKGTTLPAPDADGFRNDAIRVEVLKRLNGNTNYKKLFGAIFPAVGSGGAINFSMFGRAVAEFEFSLVFTNAPIDRYARGDLSAMTEGQKHGAILFFGKANCVYCHAVRGKANEMFSDFENRSIGVPQVAPFFGVGQGNVVFDGPFEDEDYGLEQITGDTNDRYKFRTSPLRNVGLQPAFMHNGAFTRLEDAIRHHLNVADSALHYNPIRAGLPKDLTHRLGPIADVLKTVDDAVAKPLHLSRAEFEDLVEFVRESLTDPRARKENLCSLVPATVPSGVPTLTFESCRP